LQSLAKQNAKRFLSSKSGDLEEFKQKIKDKEAHKNDLMEKKKKACKQFEMTSKLESSEKGNVDHVHGLISRRQENLKEMKDTLALWQPNFATRFEEAKTIHEELKAKNVALKENLSGKKNFDESLETEMKRKHQERMKPLEKKFHAKKDDFAG